VTSNYGSAAWKGLNTGAKVMATTALDLLTDSELLTAIKEEFAEYSKTHHYKSFLPENSKPPLYLNRDLMDKYRVEMMKASQH
jgi:aminobenzoyl-glutamate utilization protein B